MHVRNPQLIHTTHAAGTAIFDFPGGVELKDAFKAQLDAVASTADSTARFFQAQPEAGSDAGALGTHHGAALMTEGITLQLGEESAEILELERLAADGS